MSTIPFKPLTTKSSMRKLALGAWGRPTDPSVNVQLDMDITETNIFLKNNPDIDLKHIIIKVFSQLIVDIPELNTVLIRNKLRQRSNNRIFIPTIFRHKRTLDLSGVSIDDAYSKSLNELSTELTKQVFDLRTLKNAPIRRTIKIFKKLPDRLCKPIIKLLDFIQYTLNISLQNFGLPSDPFGSLTITFLDKYNIRYADIPIYPFSRSPITICIGKQYTTNETDYLPMVATFDHRHFDGYEGHKAIKRLQYLLNHPSVL